MGRVKKSKGSLLKSLEKANQAKQNEIPVTVIDLKGEMRIDSNHHIITNQSHYKILIP